MVISNPRIFAIVFACMIVFLSILRGATLINGGVILENLPLILLINAPVGLIEGYGIYLTIKKTLNITITTKALFYIFGIFLLTSIIEVGFINLLGMFAV